MNKEKNYMLDHPKVVINIHHKLICPYEYLPALMFLDYASNQIPGHKPWKCTADDPDSPQRSVAAPAHTSKKVPHRYNYCV